MGSRSREGFRRSAATHCRPDRPSQATQARSLAPAWAMLLLDTHALVWLVQGDRRLGRPAKGRIAGAWPGALTVSTLSWYEMGCLVQRGRIRLSQSLASQRQSLLEGGMVEQPVSATIALD